MYDFAEAISLSRVTVNKNNVKEEKEKCGVTFFFHELQKKRIIPSSRVE
jgi:hypothetical protein